MSGHTRRLAGALEAQRAAIDHFTERAAGVVAGWTTPRAPGAWSPAEITEHLALVFDAVTEEIKGGPGIRARFGPLRRLLFRWIALPRIVAGRGFPGGVRAVREARPVNVTASRDESLDRLLRTAERFEEAVRSAPPATRVTHPFFGRLTLPRAVRFSAAHIRHHAAQLPQEEQV